MISRLTLIAAWLLAGLPLLGCAPADDRPNVILLTVDTLRADRLHCYGHPRATSPVIDQLASQGTLFERSSTVATRTAQSLAAIVSARYPQVTGVHIANDRLKEDELTLAEVLKGQGYDTAAVVRNQAIRRTNLGQGFDLFLIQNGHMAAQETNKEVLGWLRQDRDAPVFAWVHHMDPHMPYQPPSEFSEQFYPDYRGRFKRGFKFFFKSRENEGVGSELLKPKVVFNHTRLSEPELEWIKALYDGEIAYIDMQIGILLQEMREMGLLDNALVIFSSDHGESLGEHEYYFAHGDFVYEPTTHVPLIFHWPGRIPAGQRIPQHVRTIDILPTTLGLLGVPDPFEGRDGTDLSPAMRGEEQLVDLPVFVESGRCKFMEYNPRRHVADWEGSVRAYRDGRWKLILTPTEAEPVLELYDLETDPWEERNLAEQEPARTQRMTEVLLAWMEQGEGYVEQPLDPETEQSLRELGYID